MRTPLIHTALLALSAGVLAACSSEPPSDPSTPLPSSMVETKLGQVTTLYPSDGTDTQMTFAVDKIEVDPQCGQHGSRAAGTHTVLLYVRVQPLYLATAADSASLARRIDPLAFRAYDAGRNPHTSQPDTCTDPAPPTAYLAKSTYWGRVGFSTDIVPTEVALPIMSSTGTEVLVWEV